MDILGWIVAGGAVLWAFMRGARGGFRDASSGEDAEMLLASSASETSSPLVRDRSGKNITRRFADGTLRWVGDVRETARARGTDPLVLLSLVDQESAGDPDAEGALDEFGLTQMRPIAVEDVAQNTPLPFIEPASMSPRESLTYGAEFLELQKSRMPSGTYYDALRAYNCGAGGAKRSPGCGGSYANDVLGRINYSRGRK